MKILGKLLIAATAVVITAFAIDVAMKYVPLEYQDPDQLSIEDLEKLMWRYADKEKYDDAARIRDMIKLRKAA